MKETNEQFVRRWVDEVWNRGNKNLILEYFPAQAEAYLEGLPDVVRGPQDLLAQWQILREAFPDFHLNIEAMISSGEEVAFRWSMTGTHLGTLIDIAPTGRKIAAQGQTWMTFKDGKMVRGWDCWNQGQMLATLRTTRECLAG